MKKKAIIFIILMILIVSFAGCVPSDGSYSVESPAGFFSGIWHGAIWFITFFMGIFTGGKYTIYEAINTGWSYNLGFLIGIGAVFGGAGSSSRKNKKNG